MTQGKAHDKHRIKVDAAGGQDAERPAAEAAASGEPVVSGDGAVEELTAELVAVTQQRDDYLDHLRRLQAEFDNYRKRVRRDSDDLRTRAAQGLVEEILPVLDNMYLACEAAKEHEEGKLVQGVGMVTDQLCGLLKAHGVEELAATPGEPFDPTVHEAMSAIPSPDVAEGAIVQVMSRGYMLGERVLRPARVVVSAGAPGGGAPSGDKPKA
jgi:molecular chaperone GrpE